MSHYFIYLMCQTLINYLFGLSDLIFTQLLLSVVLYVQIKKPGPDDIS